MSLSVEVVYAWPNHYVSRRITLPAGSNVAQALSAAKLENTEHSVALAIYGIHVSPQYVLHDGDRIELLRPLLRDPKESRRRRAQVKQRRNTA